MTETPQIVVVGCGAIGLPLATAFAARGCDVLGVDTDPARLAALRAGRVGLIDEGLGDALATAVGAGRLAFTDTIGGQLIISEGVERAKGIEPFSRAWEARVMPLYDARAGTESNKTRTAGAIARSQPFG